MVSGAPELELGAEGGPGDQVRWFGEAVAAFAKALGKPMPVLSERFPAPAGAVEPFVLMQGRALLAVLDQGPGREDPRDLPLDELAASLMGHERRRWRAVAASWEWGSGTAPSEQVQGRAVAALALLGADTKTEAAEIVQRVPELGDAPAERVAAVVSWAAGLYPGGPGVAPLIRPALIGEWFVVSELTADPDLARSVRAGMSQEQAARALGFLARAADHLEAASGLFKDFAGGDLNRLILAAVLAARTGEAGRRLLDPAIASQIAAADDWTLDQLTGLQATVPGYLLLQTHVTIARLVVTARRALAAADPARQANLADALDNLGAWLGRVGRYREALEATEEAIALYRPLAAEGPAYQANLADALDNLGVRLGRVARYREALEATEEAIALYRPLAAEGPAHQANLARALDNLGVDLDRVARYREALEATEEVIALYRPLAAEDPAHQANLARALDNLGVDLDRVGRYREALEATEEAIALYRPLAADNPAHQANLARALDNLGVDLDRVARYREALEATEEAIALYRPLAADNPAHQTNLARALDNLSVTWTGWPGTGRRWRPRGGHRPVPAAGRRQPRPPGQPRPRAGQSRRQAGPGGPVPGGAAGHGGGHRPVPAAGRRQSRPPGQPRPRPGQSRRRAGPGGPVPGGAAGHGGGHRPAPAAGRRQPRPPGQPRPRPEQSRRPAGPGGPLCRGTCCTN